MRTLRAGAKVILNFHRLSRGTWVVAAAIDRTGMVFYQNFIGAWPRAHVAPEVLAAILNGPIANAFLAERELKRHLRLQTLSAIPVPQLTESASSTITALVQKYAAVRHAWLRRLGQSDLLESAHQLEGEATLTELAARCDTLQRQIDAQVLLAYDLSPRLERVVLDLFAAQQRPGPVAFERYYPEGYTPALSYDVFLSDAHADARLERALSDGPRIDGNGVADDAMAMMRYVATDDEA